MAQQRGKHSRGVINKPSPWLPSERKAEKSYWQTTNFSANSFAPLKEMKRDETSSGLGETECSCAMVSREWIFTDSSTIRALRLNKIVCWGVVAQPPVLSLAGRLWVCVHVQMMGWCCDRKPSDKFFLSYIFLLDDNDIHNSKYSPFKW